MSTESRETDQKSEPQQQRQQPPTQQQESPGPVKRKKYRYSISHERIEHISDLIGSWGPLQKKLFLLLSIIYLAAPFNNASLFFYAIKSDVICGESDGSETAVASDKCIFEEMEYCSYWYHNITRTTVTKEWDLVCERYWLRSVVLSAYQFGYLISGVLVGIISDTYGRKLAILFCILIEVICSLGLILSHDVYIFIVIRVFHGVGGYGRFLASMILLLESVGPKMRGRIAVCYEWVWYFGEYAMILITYNILKFRYIFMGSLIFQLLCIGIVSTIPESPRWQLVQGKIDDAEETLRFYAKKKRKKDEGEAEKEEDEEEQDDLFNRKLEKLREYLQTDLTKGKSAELTGLFRHPKISRFLLALYLIWFIRAFIGWGLIYSTLDLSGDVFINNAIILSANVMANAFMTWKIDRFPRKKLLITLFLMASVILCCSIAFVESHDHIVLRMILISSGGFCSSGAYILIYVYTSEIFPTSIRHLGTGTCSVASRVASIAAPFFAQLTSLTSPKLTFGIMALLGLIGALAATRLPETKDKEIPDTVEGMVELHTADQS